MEDSCGPQIVSRLPYGRHHGTVGGSMRWFSVLAALEGPNGDAPRTGQRRDRTRYFIPWVPRLGAWLEWESLSRQVHPTLSLSRTNKPTSAPSFLPCPALHSIPCSQLPARHRRAPSTHTHSTRLQRGDPDFPPLAPTPPCFSETGRRPPTRVRDDDRPSSRTAPTTG